MLLGMKEWLDNFTQLNYGAISKGSTATIPNPYLEYSIYTTTKSVQIASFLGGIIAHPIYRLYKIRNIDPATETSNTRKIIRNACRKLQGRFLLAGFAIGPLAAAASIMYNKWDRARVELECYKVRTSGDALVYDRITFVMGFCGWYWKRFQGAVDGINLAAAYTLFYIGVLKPFTNPLLVDKFSPDELEKDPSDVQKDIKIVEYFKRKPVDAKSPFSTN